MVAGRISQGVPRSRLLRCGHRQQFFLAPRTPDQHRRLSPPTHHRAPDADDRDPVCLALGAIILGRLTVGLLGHHTATAARHAYRVVRAALPD